MSSKEKYLKLLSINENKYLTNVIFKLTILLRMIYIDYENDRDKIIKITKIINEINHIISSQLISGIEKNKNYPDSVLLDILFEKAENEDFLKGLIWVLDEAAVIIK